MGASAVERTVYSQHLVENDGVKAVYDPDRGITHNYYGGYGEPDGEWHGHTNVDEDGNPIHRGGGRPVGEKRGKHRR